MKPATTLRSVLAIGAALAALTACSASTTNTAAPSQPIPSLVDASSPAGASSAATADPTDSSASANPSGATSPAASPGADVERDKAIALAIRDKLQQAYNQLPTDTSLDAATYDRIYLPVWDSAERYGFSLTRKPIPYVDGFTLSSTQATQPGHALMTELTSGLTLYCVASTDVLNPELLDQTQWEQAQELPREFLLLEGSCQPHFEWVSAYIATMAPIDPSATPQTTP